MIYYSTMIKWINVFRLTTTWEAEKRSVWTKWKSNWYEKCMCSCGNIARVNRYHLTKKTWRPVKSCWCLREEVGVRNKDMKYNVTHGMAHSKEYAIFNGIVNRCTNKNSKSYQNYWWRWIVCMRKTFEEFYKDMWQSHKWLSIDRIDNNGNYCKENCRWATQKQQANNTRTNIVVTYNWHTDTLKVICENAGVGEKYKSIHRRLKMWRTIEDAIHTPFDLYHKWLLPWHMNSTKS